ncbi:MAG: peptidoglycan-binding protein [Clostridia bacterium]|nr:peptidoglycan-binding protein [Clostridia bacterium]
MYNIQDKTAVIREIKRYLYDVAHNMYPQMKSTTVDGIFDAESAEVVREYQKIRGLPINGSVDYITFLALAKDYENVLRKKEQRDFILSGTPFSYSRGDYGDDVRVINLILSELSDVYRSLPHVGKGSYYSAYTCAAVREMRKVFMMEDSDEVDAALYERMLTELDAIQRNKRHNDLKNKEWA